MSGKVCCVTGHRVIPAEQLERVESELRSLILQAIADGYDTFLSGFAEGTDQLFARLVLELQKEHPIRMEAVLPHSGRAKCSNPEFQALLSQCHAVHIAAEKFFTGCFFARNRWMVERSDLLIAVYDGRQRGGSFYTIQYAKGLGREIAFVNVVS